MVQFSTNKIPKKFSFKLSRSQHQQSQVTISTFLRINLAFRNSLIIREKLATDASNFMQLNSNGRKHIKYKIKQLQAWFMQHISGRLPMNPEHEKEIRSIIKISNVALLCWFRSIQQIHTTPKNL